MIKYGSVDLNFFSESGSSITDPSENGRIQEAVQSLLNDVLSLSLRLRRRFPSCFELFPK